MKGDGAKLKSSILFAGTNREATALDEEFKKHCGIDFTSNGWMNKELTLDHVDEVLGSYGLGMEWRVCVCARNKI